MNWIFLDAIEWDYDALTPLLRPLGGSQSALCYLATALARRGHAVTTLTGTLAPRDVRSVRCLSHREVPTSVFESPGTVVVVLNGPGDLAMQVRPALPPQLPLILWTQHAHDQPAMHPLAQPSCLALWDRIVCISQWQRGMFQQQLGVPAERMEVLKNAIGPAFQGLFGEAGELQTAKKGPPRLAYTSTPFRGLDVLVACFPEIRRQHPACRLDVYSSMRVYGSEGTEDAYQHLYDQCRGTEGIDYHGSLPQLDLARRLRGVSVLAYPNTFPETCCIAALEALAAGALVVTSDLAALPETCGGFGRLVPPIGPEHSPVELGRDFTLAVCAALAELTRDRSAFAARQFAQVQALNAAHTWDHRALEWEQAAARWLAARQR